MENIIAKVAKQVAGIQGCQFASLVYTTKKTGECARYTVNLGFSYNTLVEKSVTELEILMAENETVWGELEKAAAAEVMASLVKTLEAHKNGQQNEDYTKKDQYIPVANGVNINTVDNTVQLFGLLHTKVSITPGVFKAVKSAPMTIAKNKIRKQLSISNFREFAMDLSQLETVKVNGTTFEI